MPSLDRPPKPKPPEILLLCDHCFKKKCWCRPIHFVVFIFLGILGFISIVLLPILKIFFEN